MKRKQPERQLQRAVFDYLKRAMPADSFFSAIPGGDRQMTRAPGYVSGLPDLIIIHNGAPIFIELKSATGRLSEAQKDVRDAIWRAGGFIYVARSIDDVQAILTERGISLRASTGYREAA